MAGHILKNRKSTKSLKNRFWPKIQILVEWPILAGMMIYGRKWVLKVFQNRFAPKIIILTQIDHILSNFEKLDFFFIFDLWVLAIWGPVEYSTGPKSAKYRPELVYLTHAPFQKKNGGRQVGVLSKWHVNMQYGHFLPK